MATCSPPRHMRRDALLEWLPAAAGAVFLFVLVTRLGHIISVVYRDSDAASAPVLADLLADAPPGRAAFLGNYPWYESLWFLQLTRGAPHHRLVWHAGPVLLYFATVALVAGAAWKALGRRAGLLGAAVLVCVSSPARAILFAQNFHAATAAHAALLGAALVVLARRPGWRAWQLALIAVALGVATAPGVASDDLTLVVAIAPLAVAGLALWYRDAGQRGVALCALAACVIALVLGHDLHQRMLADHIAPQSFPLTFLAGTDIPARLSGLVQAFAALVGGDIFGRAVDAPSLLRLCALALAATALVLIAAAVRDRLRAPGAARGAGGSPQAAGALAHVAFWALSGAGALAACLLGNLPGDAGAARYLVTVWLAMGALVGLLAGATAARRTALAVGATLFVVIGTVTLLREGSDERPGLVTDAELGQLVAYARHSGVRHGLGGYQDAANITWATHERLRLLAVDECSLEWRFCPYPVHRVTTSYDAVPTERSMLVVDSRQPMVTGPDPRHGRPLSTVSIGALTVYVYGYDIRTRISRP